MVVQGRHIRLYMLERFPSGLSGTKLRESVPLIVAVKYVAAQKRHPPADHKG
jgi:hypothetical protein